MRRPSAPDAVNSANSRLTLPSEPRTVRSGPDPQLRQRYARPQSDANEFSCHARDLPTSGESFPANLRINSPSMRDVYQFCGTSTIGANRPAKPVPPRSRVVGKAEKASQTGRRLNFARTARADLLAAWKRNRAGGIRTHAALNATTESAIRSTNDSSASGSVI